jgi:hypothetical protein
MEMTVSDSDDDAIKMQLYVFSDVPLPSIEAWQQAIDADGFALRLSAERPLPDLSGALPVWLDGRATAFDCDHEDAGARMDMYDAIDFGHRWRHLLALQWGVDIDALIAAYMAGASYARATGGIILHGFERELIAPQRAADIARETEAQIPAYAEAMRKMKELEEKFR